MAGKPDPEEVVVSMTGTMDGFSCTDSPACPVPVEGKHKLTCPVVAHEVAQAINGGLTEPGTPGWEAGVYLRHWGDALDTVVVDLRRLADRIEGHKVPGEELRDRLAYDFQGALLDVMHAQRAHDGNSRLGGLVKAATEAALAQAANPQGFADHRAANP
jgi:hypothetical protein